MQAKNDAARLILIRHGETDWNVQGRYQGQADVPLNARGRQQAARVAESLANSGISAIYASDLRRARETAEALARVTGLEVCYDSRLREVDQGEWEGMPFAEIQSRYPELVKRRRENPLAVPPPGGETVRQVRERALAAVGDIIRAHPGGRIAIISHGLSLAVIRAHCEGRPIEEVWELVPGNGEVVEVVWPRNVGDDRSVSSRRQLLEQELARYLQILTGRPGLEQVIVFGSLATGETHPWSDIDLVIVQRSDLPFWRRLREMRRLLRPRVATDLLVYTPAEFKHLSRERMFFQQEILAQGKIVYERNG